MKNGFVRETTTEFRGIMNKKDYEGLVHFEKHKKVHKKMNSY